MNWEEWEERLYREKQRQSQEKRRKKRRLLAAALLVLLALGAAVFLSSRGVFRPRAIFGEEVFSREAAGERARIRLLDVGQGLGILVESAGEAMLIDGGGGSASSRTVAVLKERGIRRLRYIVMTHYDEDHIGGAVGALAAIGAENLLGPDYEKDSRTYRSLLRRAAEAGLEIAHPMPGEEYELGVCRFRFFSPLGDPREENDNSLILRLTDGLSSILITGDAEAAAEKAAAARWGGALRSDIYVIGHHGSYTSSTKELLRAVRPDYLLLSCGEGNEYAHPHASVMEALRKSGAFLWRTDKQGDISLLFTEQGIIWEKAPTADWTPGQGK